jgi:hypothetical protein
MSSTSEVPAEAGAQRAPEPAFTPGRFAPSDGGWSAI